MVSLNLLRYRDEVKRALLARKNELDQEWDPFVASWLAYAFLCETGAPSLLAQEVFKRLEAWSQEESAWNFRRNIAPLLFLIWLEKRFNHVPDDAFVERVTVLLKTLNPDDKFSPLRHPEQVFLMALGISEIKGQDGNEFTSAISSQLRGSLARQILFTAALRELGQKRRLPISEPRDVTDVLALLWWAERYGEGVDRSVWWSKFESLADTVLLHKAEEFDTRRVLSEWELVLLYEALIQQTSKPDPAMLFDYYPLHPRIKEIAEQDFKRGYYFGAVFEACKALEDYLKRASDVTKIGVRLVEEVLGKPDMNSSNFSPPVVKINPLDKTSTDFVSQLDEQKGFSSLTIGIFQAFRNPKGHQPKDKNWVGIDAYEALDQLVIVSLVVRRIEGATGIKP